MARFLAVVPLSASAHVDVTGPRQRFAMVERYLARRGISVGTVFHLGDRQHLLVLDAEESPTRYLNRALALAWPELGERARAVRTQPWAPRPYGDEARPLRQPA